MEPVSSAVLSVTLFFMQNESWTNFLITLYYLTVSIPSEIRKRSLPVRMGQTRRHTILRSTWSPYLITCAHLPNSGIFGRQRKLLKRNDMWRERSPCHEPRNTRVHWVHSRLVHNEYNKWTHLKGPWQYYHRNSLLQISIPREESLSFVSHPRITNVLLSTQ